MVFSKTYSHVELQAQVIGFDNNDILKIPTVFYLLCSFFLKKL